VENPHTVATAIRIGNPASWKGAMAAKEESGGLIDTVTDEEILAAQRMLAEEEGIFVEPASAASVAGVLKKAREGLFQGRETVVCVLTGHGLKDPDIAIKQCEGRVEEVGASQEEGYRARIRNHGHSCFLCEIVIRSQFHTTYEPEA
jgi:L-threonine synthase (EC 4.2.3.1)